MRETKEPESNHALVNQFDAIVKSCLLHGDCLELMAEIPAGGG